MENRLSNLDAKIWYFLCWRNSQLILLDCHAEICSCLFGLRSYFKKNTVYLIYKDKSWRCIILNIRRSLCEVSVILCHSTKLGRVDQFMWKSEIQNFTQCHPAVCTEFHWCGRTDRYTKLIARFLQLFCDTPLSGTLVEEKGMWPLPGWIDHTWVRWTDDWWNVVEQSLEELRYKPDDCGFDSRWGHWEFLLN
jgi:hypothetical protein